MIYKFRGKSTITNAWVYGSLLQREDSIGPLSIIEVQHKFPHEPEQVHVIAETVGQFTGWNDKHGNEIYQGDKLQGNMGEQQRDNGSPIVGEVYFKNGGFEVFSKPMTRGYEGDKLNMFCWCDHGSHGMPDTYWQIDNIEIIDNIHEVKPAVKDSL